MCNTQRSTFYECKREWNIFKRRYKTSKREESYKSKLFSTWQARVPLPMAIKASILDCIGDTPIVKLNNLPKILDLECEIFVKCEFMNPGGSVKDRIAKGMYDSQTDALGRKSLVEASSGNTGIGLAMLAASKGIGCTIVMPEKMSNEKESVIKALGANVVRTPTEASHDSKESHHHVAQSIRDLNPNSFAILDQYHNEFNPLTHYKDTAEEIIRDVGKFNAIVIGAGTGGTISGISKKLKKYDSNIQVIGIDPVGSILSGGKGPRSYQVEGIGYDFFPKVLDLDLIDSWERVNDRQSFLMARALIRYEGLLCGGSSGSAMAGAYNAIQRLGLNRKNARIVIILPDSIRNYLSKFASDDWMFVHKYLNFNLEDPWKMIDLIKEMNAYEHIEDFSIESGIEVAKYTIWIKAFDLNTTLNQAIYLSESEAIPVTNDGKPYGVVSRSIIAKALLNRKDPNTTKLYEIADKDLCISLTFDFKISRIGALRLLKTVSFVFIVDHMDLLIRKDNQMIQRIDLGALLSDIGNNQGF